MQSLKSYLPSRLFQSTAIFGHRFSLEDLIGALISDRRSSATWWRHTGGTALVPAVRKVFADRFGADRLRGGDELTSVASGLALRALELTGG